MTDLERAQIQSLREQGYGYTTIAKAVGMKKDTVVAFCRKQGLAGTKAPSNERVDVKVDICRNCGTPLIQTPGIKKRVFCSDECRTTWWNSHPEMVNRRAVYERVCAGCGKPCKAFSTILGSIFWRDCQFSVLFQPSLLSDCFQKRNRDDAGRI